MSLSSPDLGCTIEVQRHQRSSALLNADPTQETCQTNTTQPPSLSLGPNNTTDIESQMKHFATNDQMNIFRLPIPWQSNITSPTAPLQLNPPSLAQYDRLLQSCLSTGAHCIIALLDNPSATADLTSLWTSLAKTYASSPSVIFELPLPPASSNITSTLQTTVSAIRTSGATSQMILLPGLEFSSPEEAESTGAALAGITNPDGSTANLLFALRRFLDDGQDNAGQCTTNNNAAFDTAAKYLRGIGRLAVVSETGVPAGGDGVCLVWFCEQNRFVNGVGDVVVGLVVGGVHGKGDGDGGDGVTPRWEGRRWVDTPVVGNCVVGTWLASTDGSGGGRGIGGVIGGGGRVGVAWWVVGAGLGVGLVGL